MGLITAELKTAIGRTLPPQAREVTRREIRKYAVATDQCLRRYREGDEAPPLFLFGLFLDICPLGQLLPDGRQPDNGVVPTLPLKRVMAGGSEMHLYRPARPGDVILRHQTLVDLFEKEGRQGPLIFAVVENRFETETGEAVMTERLTRIAR